MKTLIIIILCLFSIKSKGQSKDLLIYADSGFVPIISTMKPIVRIDTIPCVMMVSDTSSERSMFGIPITHAEAKCKDTVDAVWHSHSLPVYTYPERIVYTMHGYIIQQSEYLSGGIGGGDNRFTPAVNTFQWLPIKTIGYLNQNKQQIAPSLMVWMSFNTKP